MSNMGNYGLIIITIVITWLDLYCCRFVLNTLGYQISSLRLQWILFSVILHGSTLYWLWLCYHLIMDLCLCIVAMILLADIYYHGSSLYWSEAMLLFIWYFGQLCYSSFHPTSLPSISSLRKEFTYHVPQTSCFGKHSVTPKSHHVEPCFNPIPSP